MLLLATIAHAKLLYGDLEGTKTDMDSAWKVLDTLEGVENIVNASYYGVAADYYKVRLGLIVLENLDVDEVYRPRQSMHRIIGIRCFTWLVSMSRKTCRKKRDWVVLTI